MEGIGGLLEANWLKITMATGKTISSQPVFLNPVRMNGWLSGKDFLWYISAGEISCRLSELLSMAGRVYSPHERKGLKKELFHPQSLSYFP